MIYNPLLLIGSREGFLLAVGVTLVSDLGVLKNCQEGWL